MGTVSPEQAEQVRSETARKWAGDDPAPARPALGFELDKTQPKDVHAWAAKHGFTCKDERDGALLRCTNVPAAARVWKRARRNGTGLTGGAAPVKLGCSMLEMTTGRTKFIPFYVAGRRANWPALFP